MRKKVKQLWVDALRSGKYEQGRKVLCSLDNKYCCLGVLTEVYIEQMKKNRKKSKVSKLHISNACHLCEQYRVEGKCNATHLLPEVVTKWAGLTTGQRMWAMSMNDSHTLDFSGIAQCIDFTF
jgi:hypothetical protein